MFAVGEIATLALGWKFLNAIFVSTMRWYRSHPLDQVGDVLKPYGPPRVVQVGNRERSHTSYGSMEWASTNNLARRRGSFESGPRRSCFGCTGCKPGSAAHSQPAIRSRATAKTLVHARITDMSPEQRGTG